jgi:hypothetical protein
MKHAAVSMDMEGSHKLVPLDEDVSILLVKLEDQDHLKFQRSGVCHFVFGWSVNTLELVQLITKK